MMDGLYELAAARGAPVLLHTGHEFGALPWLVGGAARRHPRVTYVMAHMGLFTIECVDGAIDVAKANPNVRMDTAAMPFPWKIKEAVERVGAARLMYGSEALFFSTP